LQSSEIIGAAQYRAVFVIYINALSVRFTLLDADDQLAQCRQTAARDLVVLYKAPVAAGRADDKFSTRCEKRHSASLGPAQLAVVLQHGPLPALEIEHRCQAMDYTKA
jgi:hypothetical protein